MVLLGEVEFSVRRSSALVSCSPCRTVTENACCITGDAEEILIHINSLYRNIAILTRTYSSREGWGILREILQVRGFKLARSVAFFP